MDGADGGNSSGGIRGLPPSTHFAEMGGDSLKALRAVHFVREAWITASAEAGQPSAAATLKEDGAGGTFGEDLGAFGPAELLARPRLGDYARFLRTALGPLPSAEESAQVEIASPQTDRATEQRRADERLLMRAAGLGLSGAVAVLVDVVGVPASGTLATASAAGRAAPRATRPLHCACLAGSVGTAAALLARGADLTARDATGATPLHLACQRGPVRLVELLLAGGRKPVVAATTETASRRGAGGRRRQQQQRRADGGRRTETGPGGAMAALVARDDDGQMPLHHAARSGAPRAVLELLLAQPGVAKAQATAASAVDRWGRTPLHWAAANGRRDAVAVLLEASGGDRGALLGARDAAGETAREIAERRARCGVQRPAAGAGGGGERLPASVFGDIARLLGGSGTTASVRRLTKAAGEAGSA
ncbi:hypothetical protein HK405_008179 [Cladochytrium tenue]|nr:hypothetical protein HK405_008179 [Cladochytrium tenue]